MKNDENDSVFDLSVVPPFLKFEQNKFIQRETNLSHLCKSPTFITGDDVQ